MPNRGAPKPDNFDAMVAAWNDPVQFPREVAKYNDQLLAAGHLPVYEQFNGREDYDWK